MMHTSPDGFDIAALTVAERIDLAQRLWESVRDEIEGAPLTPGEIDEIETRIAAIDSGFMVCEPLEVVVGRIARR